MKPLIVALALVVATRAAAADPKIDILDAVDAGIKAESEASDAAASKKSASDDEIRLIYWNAERDARRRAEGSYNRAITLTQEAYGLASPVPANPAVAPPSSPNGKWAERLPAPRSIEFASKNYRSVMGTDGKPHYLSDNPLDAGNEKALAITDPDGKTTLHPRAMRIVAETREPGVLAMTIHHENLHYQDLITTGWSTHEEMEIRTFTESLNKVDSFLQPENTALSEAIKESIRGVIASNTALLQAGDAHSPFPTKEQELSNRNALEKQEMEERDYASLVQRVERLTRQRRENRAAAEKDLRWQKFKLWTLYACTYINGFHPGDPEWGRPDLIRARETALRGYLRNGLVVMAKDEIDAGLRRDDLVRSGDLGRCHGQMVEMIRDLPGPADADWLMDRIEYDRRGGRAGEIISGVLEAVRKAVKDGTAAIVQKTSAPFTGDRSTGSDSRGSDHGYSLPDADKLAYRQLRGIHSPDW